MNKRWVVTALMAIGLFGGCGEQAAKKTAEVAGVDLNGVTVVMPEGWVHEPSANAMRKAQFRLPGEGGDAELVVTHFGAGGAGGVDANIERWRDQFAESDGGKTRTLTVSGMPVTILDISGTFAGMQGPMSGGGAPKTDQRMLAAIVESSNGAFYFKLVGPIATVTHWQKSFDEFIASVKPSLPKA